jgi:HlyD family secretion protein
MKKGIWIFVIVVVVIGGFFGIRAARNNTLSEANASLETTTVARGALTATIGATGVVRANQTAEIFWKTSGTVEEVLVSVGSQVDESEELANLLQTSLSQSIILAQADFVNAQKDLDSLYDGFDSLALANAKQVIADAELELQTVQYRWNNLNYPTYQPYIDDAESSLTFAREDLKNAQDAYDRLGCCGNKLVRAQRQAALAQAQLSFDSSEQRYNYLVGSASPLAKAEGDANLVVAKEDVEEAKRDYDKLIAGPTADDILAAEARVAASQATLDLISLSAPFAGTITKSEISHGDLVSASTLGFRLDDLSILVVDLDVSEVDINRVFVGQEVSLFFDAILGNDYVGEVISVSPVGEITGGIVNFKVSIEVTDPDEFVKPGMTAAVNIVVSEIENVLIVPNRAVRVVDGERVVYVVSDSGPEAITIELGSNSDFYSEVISGDLNEGDEIIMNPPADFNGFGGPGGNRDGGPFGGH